MPRIIAGGESNSPTIVCCANQPHGSASVIDALMALPLPPNRSLIRKVKY